MIRSESAMFKQVFVTCTLFLQCGIQWMDKQYKISRPITKNTELEYVMALALHEYQQEFKKAVHGSKFELSQDGYIVEKRRTLEYYGITDDDHTDNI